MSNSSNRILIRDYNGKEVQRFFGIFLYKDDDYKGYTKICTDEESRAFLKRQKAKPYIKKRLDALWVDYFTDSEA